MQRIEERADKFENSLERALDRNSLNGSDLEDRLNRWAAIIEDEIDNMAEDYNGKNSKQFIDDFENVMIGASGINRAMLAKDLAPAEADWRAIREDLNTIAMEFSRPVLPNLTVVTIIPVSGELMARGDVQQVMGRIESSTDRFEEKFWRAIQHSTSNMTAREQWFDDWADALEDTSDDMLEEFKEKDAKEFGQKLLGTFVVAQAIDRMMLRSSLAREANLEWDQLRADLNTIAGVFGLPVLPNTVVSVTEVKKHVG